MGCLNKKFYIIACSLIFAWGCILLSTLGYQQALVRMDNDWNEMNKTYAYIDGICTPINGYIYYNRYNTYCSYSIYSQYRWNLSAPLPCTNTTDSPSSYDQCFSDIDSARWYLYEYLPTITKKCHVQYNGCNTYLGYGNIPNTFNFSILVVIFAIILGGIAILFLFMGIMDQKNISYKQIN